jgi:hypothetical protein
VLNTKRKLLRTNAHIWFNQTCQNRNIIPKYANIAIKGTSRAIKLTQKQAIKLRIKNEIKYLYVKKQNINNQLYKLHLKNVQYWHTNWTIIENIIIDRHNVEARTHYNKLKDKITNLIKQSNHGKQASNKQTFYPRLHNMTNVQLSEKEDNLLNNGGKYNMGIAPIKGLKQLIYETENAIRQVENPNQQQAIRHLAAKNIQQIISKHNTASSEHREQLRTTKQIQHKLLQTKATIAEADKGKTLVIIYKQDLNQKVNSFIMNNNIAELKTDRTQKFQRITQNTLKQ